MANVRENSDYRSPEVAVLNCSVIHLQYAWALSYFLPLTVVKPFAHSTLIMNLPFFSTTELKPNNGYITFSIYLSFDK